MKKNLTIIAVIALIASVFTACNKDCVCRYYDSAQTLVNTEIHDGDDVSNTECSDMNGRRNVVTEVNDNLVTADNVSCDAGGW